MYSSGTFMCTKTVQGRSCLRRPISHLPDKSNFQGNMWWSEDPSMMSVPRRKVLLASLVTRASTTSKLTPFSGSPIYTLKVASPMGMNLLPITPKSDYAMGSLRTVISQASQNF